MRNVYRTLNFSPSLALIACALFTSACDFTAAVGPKGPGNVKNLAPKAEPLTMNLSSSGASIENLNNKTMPENTVMRFLFKYSKSQ